VLNFSGLQPHHAVPVTPLLRLLTLLPCLRRHHVGREAVQSTFDTFGHPHTVSFCLVASGLWRGFERCVADVLDWIGMIGVASVLGRGILTFR